MLLAVGVVSASFVEIRLVWTCFAFLMEVYEGDIWVIPWGYLISP